MVLTLYNAFTEKVVINKLGDQPAKNREDHEKAKMQVKEELIETLKKSG